MAVEQSLDDLTVASSEPLGHLVSLASKCLGSKDHSRNAVAYAVLAFLKLEEIDRHEASFPVSQAEEFRDRIDAPLRRAVSFIEQGGTPESAVSIISDLSRL